MTQNYYNNMSAVFYDQKAAEEEKYIKRAGNTIGGMCILTALVSFFWFYGAVYISALFGVTRDQVYNAVSDPGFMQFVQILFSTLMFVFPFLLAAKIMKTPVSKSLEFNKVKGKDFRAYLYIGLAFCAFSNLAVNYAGVVFENFGINYNMPDSESPVGITGFILVTLSSAVVPAMAEEFGMRGILLGILRPMGDGFAVLVSALVFGLIHGNFSQIPFAFLVGLVLGYIRVKSNSMIVCIIIHFANNFISVCASYSNDILGISTTNIIYILYLAIVLALGIVGVRYLYKNGDVNFKKADTNTPERKKVTRFFTSPLMIVFIIITFIMSSLYFFV